MLFKILVYQIYPWVHGALVFLRFLAYPYHEGQEGQSIQPSAQKGDL